MKYIHYNSNEEFFYDNSFEDYEKYYLLKFTEVKTKNIHVANELYIYPNKPKSIQLDLIYVIGLFYPKKDNVGIYGRFKFWNNFTEENFFTLLEYCKIQPLGISTYNENQEMDHYSIQCTYLD